MYLDHAGFVEQFGAEEVLLLADRAHTGEADESVTARALSDATDLINQYLRVRYSVPVSPVPPTLRRVCGDLAMYALSTDNGLLTDDKRRRYEDALRLLRDLANGTAELGLPSGQSAPSAGSGVIFAQRPRRFTR